MRIPVVWLYGQRGYWDHGLLMDHFRGALHEGGTAARRYEFNEHASGWDTDAEPGPDLRAIYVARGEPFAGGAVCVLAGRHFVDKVREIRAYLDTLRWSVVLVVSDEAGTFPAHELAGEGRRIWIQSPHPWHEDLCRAGGDGAFRGFGIGYRASGDGQTRPLARAHRGKKRDKDLFFSGQINSVSRRACARAVAALGGDVRETGGFGQGMPYPAYIHHLCRTRIAPSPRGPHTPDCFRTYEALECGALPIVEPRGPRHPKGWDYWRLLGARLPSVGEWEDLRYTAEKYLDYPWLRAVNLAGGWWQAEKRRLAAGINRDIAELSGALPEYAGTLRERVTVLIPTSPVPDHPSLEHIERAIAGVRVYPELEDCEVIVMVDGVREEQAHRRDAYERYVQELLWRANYAPPGWDAVTPLVFGEHLHQAEMTRRALEITQTPQVLFIEHDTFPAGKIDWWALSRALEEEDVNTVRLSIFDSILEEHEHLFMGPVEMRGGVPLLRTKAWSQRPHLSRTAFYRRMIGDFFAEDARTMIEDVVYPACFNQQRLGQESDYWHLWMYVPTGSAGGAGHLRSHTTDARGEEPKYAMTYRYPGGRVPRGAPFPEPDGYHYEEGCAPPEAAKAPGVAAPGVEDA